MVGGSVFWFPVFGLWAQFRGWDSVLGERPGMSVVVETEVDESPEVDGGNP
jgi:hypothetical protein